MKEILKVNNLIKKFPKAGGEIDDADAILGQLKVFSLSTAVQNMLVLHCRS